MRNYWHYRASILGGRYDFLQSSNPDCPYIIGVFGKVTLYDTRRKIFGEYIVIGTYKDEYTAKRRVANLMRENKPTRKDSNGDTDASP